MQILAQVVSLAIALVGIILFVRAIRQILAVLKMGQPSNRTDKLPARAVTMLKETLGHTRMLQWRWVGAGHWFVFVGFGLLFFTLVTAFGQLFDAHFALPLIGHFFLWEWVSELFTFVMIIAIIAFIYYRATRPKERVRGPEGRFWGSTMWQGYFVEGVILGVGLCIVALRGLEYALLTKGGEHADNASALHFPLSFPVGKLFEGLSGSTIETLIYLIAMFKIVISFAWMITISLQPTMGVAWHRFLAFFNIFFRRHAGGRTALGGLAPMMQDGQPINFEDLEEMDEDTVLGVGQVEDFSWKGLLDFSTCTECGRCQSQCPAWNTEKPLSPKLLITALRDHAYAKAPYVQAAEGDRDALLEGNAALKLEAERPLVGDTGDDWFYNPDSGAAVIDSEVLWNCTSCGACVQQCPVDIEHVDHIIDMRRYAVLVESNFPSELNGLFKGLENKGNPWNMSPKARMDWAKDLPFEVKVVGEDVESLDEVEWLFWVGCAGAYEDRAKKTTRAVAELLDMAGVSFAVLGNGETCTGDPARRAGNEFVFQGLATQNAETFKETKVKKVVSTCAHCFNTLKNEYAAFGVELEVVHHTQLLNRLVREKKLAPVATADGGSKRSITYHDPCYIGRHNGVYAPPRELLNVIPDATLTEMPRNSERSFCCGAGGARMWMEENTGERINLNRTKEAVATGADQIAVGCPFCRVMLSDGLTAQQAAGEAREEVEVLDIAQMLLASVKGETKPVAKKAEPAAKAAGSAAAAGGASRTLSEDTDATKAEPEAGDATQTSQTVTDTTDAGPLAKASGGSSLFDTDGDSEPADESPATTTVAETGGTEKSGGGGSLFDMGSDSADVEAEPKTEPKAEPEPAATPSGGGSLFDLGDDSAETAAQAESEPAEKPAAQAPQTSGGSLFDLEAPAEDPAPAPAPAASEDSTPAEPTSSATPAAEVPSGGSLFDLEAPSEDPAPAASDDSTPADQDAAADSTTDGGTDRSEDAADTDVEPDTEPETQPEPEPQATSTASGTTSTPGNQIPEGGSLFDIATPAEEPVTQQAPAEATEEAPATPETDLVPDAEPTATEDAAADSTTDGGTDRSQDAADTDVEPDTEPGAPLTSLRDIKAKFADGSASSGSSTEKTEGADANAELLEESPGAPEEETPEDKPKPATSGDSHTPRTDAEIGEGGSLFDL